MIFGITPPIARIVVEPDHVLNSISPSMYGACIEDVNHEIYGGLYAQQIFGESFEEPPPGSHPKGWQVFGGGWYPDGSGLLVKAGDGPKLVREMPDLADGTVEAEIRTSNDFGDNAGLLVRVSNAGEGADAFDGYEISLGTRNGELILGKHRHDFHLLQSVPAPLTPGKWHRLKVAMVGSRIRVFLDDEATPRIDFVDHDQPLTSGKIALRTWRVDASFRDVRIDGQPCATSFAGPGVSAMWDPVGKGVFALEGNAFNGALCQKIERGDTPGLVGVANRGLNRWGISVRKGQTMEGRIFLHGDSGTAIVALQSADGTLTYAQQLVPVGKSWKKAPFRLNPSASDPNARFAVLLDRKGTLWVDQAVLFSGDRFRNLPIRGDIARALISEGLTFMRYGGSMVNVPGYRWKSMIGDPDRRPPYAGNWYPCSTNGFGIFDYLNFCEKAKFGAAFAINAEETPEDAADLADYLSAPVSNPWGRRRAADGHPAPYHPEYIEIGNEEAIGNLTPSALAHYASRFRLLAKAIHGRNPGLKLVCAAWWAPDSPAMKAVFDAVDGAASAWDLHFWCDDPNAGTSIDRELDRANRLFKTWNPKTTLKVVVFEENGARHDLQRALGHATTLNATRRHGDFVLADSAANALQPLGQNDNGWDQGGVFFTPSRAWLMPPALAQRILSKDGLPLRVAAQSNGKIDALATRSEDGRTLALTLVNPTNHPVSTSISLGNFHPKTATATELSGGLTATSPSAERNKVAAHNLTELTLPRHSIMSLRFTR